MVSKRQVEALQGFEQWQEDARLFYDKYVELQRQYADKWVAIYQGEVVGSNENKGQLCEDLRRRNILGPSYIDKVYPDSFRPVFDYSEDVPRVVYPPVSPENRPKLLRVVSKRESTT